MFCLGSSCVSNTPRGLERVCSRALACIAGMNCIGVVPFPFIFIPRNGLRLYGLAI